MENQAERCPETAGPLRGCAHGCRRPVERPCELAHLAAACEIDVRALLFHSRIHYATSARRTESLLLTRSHDGSSGWARSRDDGCEVCRVFPERRAGADRFWIVAGDERPADHGILAPAIADAVLVKPCLPDALLDEIRRGRQRVEVPVQEAPVKEGRYRWSRTHTRVTTTSPPTAPAPLICPDCDRALTYRQSHIGGISRKQSERWDEYACGSGCGAFEYRHRTRTLRRQA